MNHQMHEWTHIDKTEWGDGPWANEPDKVQWVDEATGLDCLMVRHEGWGHWCGYVGVPKEHPFYGQSYWDVGLDVDVHGGFTFTNSCDEDAEEGHGICHIPEPGRPGDVWWMGFDFHHIDDFAPGLQARMKSIDGILPDVGSLQGDHYWTREEVAAEVISVAAQLAEVT